MHISRLPPYFVAGLPAMLRPISHSILERTKLAPDGNFSMKLLRRHHRQYEVGGMIGIVIDRVGAHLVGTIDVEEERIGHGRIAIRHFDADTVARLEAIGDRLQRYLDLIDLAGR